MGQRINQDSLPSSTHRQIHSVRARFFHSVCGQERKKECGTDRSQTIGTDKNGNGRKKYGQEKTGDNKPGQMGGRQRLCQTEQN